MNSQYWLGSPSWCDFIVSHVHTSSDSAHLLGASATDEAKQMLQTQPGMLRHAAPLVTINNTNVISMCTQPY